jgi:hypothetical protein
LKYTMLDYEVAVRQHQQFVTEVLSNQILVREAKKDRAVRAEAARRRRLCLVRSVLFEVLPAKVASLVAPPCISCCSPGLAA